MTGTSQSHAPHTCTETGKVYGFAHLDAFTITVPKKGKAATDDLTIRVIFSNHVYSERIKRHDDPYDFIDHNQSKRYFDVDRYNVSMTLKQTVTDCYTDNQLVKISKSFGGTDNLIFFQDVSGNSWIVVFCFNPTTTDNLIEMHILSTHQKDDHDRKDRYQHVIATARTCLFSGQRYPT